VHGYKKPAFAYSMVKKLNFVNRAIDKSCVRSNQKATYCSVRGKEGKRIVRTKRTGVHGG